MIADLMSIDYIGVCSLYVLSFESVSQANLILPTPQAVSIFHSDANRLRADVE
jgi:hypothetical protein